MTFEEYADKYLGKHGFKDVDLTLIRMGWNARGEFGGDHLPDATKMVQGDVQLMGEVTDEEGNTYSPAMVVEFSTVEDFLAAKKAGQCRFTVFGGEV